MPSLILTWNTAGPNPCPFCISLNGTVWTFKAGTHKLPPKLSAKGRFVWDLEANHSTAHGAHRFNCNCGLTVQTDLEDVYLFAKTLREAL